MNNGFPPVWAHAPSSSSLEPGRVDLWRINLLQPKSVIDRCHQVLASDEAERAAHFRFPEDRDRSVITHGAIRYILAAYLDTSPAEVRFEYGSHGKPEIAGATDGANLRFNFSHSADLAVAGIVRESRIGVDVEHVRPSASCMDIAEQCFSDRELARLKEFPVDQQTDAFFDCWTRKEAYVKACGAGLSIPLNSFEVTFGSGDDAAPFELAAAKPDGIGPWKVYCLPVLPGYKAAMVVEGQEHQIRYWDWGT